MGVNPFREESFVFPEEYKHIEEDIKQVKENLRAVDQHILNAVDDPPNQARLDYRPPGAMPVNKQRLTKEQKADIYKNQKESIKSEAWIRTEKALKNADPEISLKIQNNVRGSLSDYQDKTLEQVKDEQHDPRSINNAQDYIDKRYNFSSRFANSLNYTQQQKAANEPTEPNPTPPSIGFSPGKS